MIRSSPRPTSSSHRDSCRPKNDPLYGVLQCGAPLDIPIEGVPAPDATATDTAIPADTMPPGDPNAPLPADTPPPPA